MEQDELIKLAKQAGGKGLHLCTDPTETTIAIRLDFEQLEAFAKLVEAYTRGQLLKTDWDNYRQGLIDGATAEREACAKVFDELAEKATSVKDLMYLNMTSALIRARGES